MNLAKVCPDGKGRQTITTKVNWYFQLQPNDLITVEYSLIKNVIFLDVHRV